MRLVIAMMLTRSMIKSARAGYQEICQTDHARAAVRACGPRGGFCKGFGPWAHDRSIASAPRGEMKSLDLNEIIEFISMWCKLCGAIYVVRSMRCELRGSSYVVQSL